MRVSYRIDRGRSGEFGLPDPPVRQAAGDGRRDSRRKVSAKVSWTKGEHSGVGRRAGLTHGTIEDRLARPGGYPVLDALGALGKELCQCEVRCTRSAVRPAPTTAPITAEITGTA